MYLYRIMKKKLAYLLTFITLTMPTFAAEKHDAPRTTNLKIVATTDVHGNFFLITSSHANPGREAWPG